MLRLFVGLALPYQTRLHLSLLAGGIPGARWVSVENFHLTLRFIGEVPGHLAEDIDLTLNGLSARGFHLSLTGVGTFDKGSRLSTLWVGVERNPALEHLRDKVERAVVRAGLEPERRKFLPHVTLARVDRAPEEKVARFVQEHGIFRHGPVEVTSFVLFQSLLGKEQAHYVPEAEYALA